MTQFLPAQIFSVSMLAYGSRATCFGLRASLFGFQTDFSGVEEDWMGCGKVACGLRRPFGVEVGTRAPPCRAARDGLARGPTLKRAVRPFRLLGPTSPQPILLLISCNPRLRLTIRFRLRAPRVSIFSSLPFFSVLNGRNVLQRLFSSSCLFAFFLQSRTPIDDLSSPTRHTSAHLLILIILFSFERSDWLLFFLCPLLFSCALPLYFFIFYTIVCFRDASHT